VSKSPPLYPLTRHGLPAWGASLGKDLRQLRTRRGLDQRDAAILIDRVPSRVSDLECGIVGDPRLYIAYAAKLDADLSITFGPDDTINHTLVEKK
jgi:transcriptional regulator with XRE-family HTH domain